MTNDRLHQFDKLYQSVALALDQLVAAVGLTLPLDPALREQSSRWGPNNGLRKVAARRNRPLRTRTEGSASYCCRPAGTNSKRARLISRW